MQIQATKYVGPFDLWPTIPISEGSNNNEYKIYSNTNNNNNNIPISDGSNRKFNLWKYEWFWVSEGFSLTVRPLVRTSQNCQAESLESLRHTIFETHMFFFNSLCKFAMRRSSISSCFPQFPNDFPITRAFPYFATFPRGFPIFFAGLSSFLVVFLPFPGQLVPPSDSTSKSLGSMPATFMQ